VIAGIGSEQVKRVVTDERNYSSLADEFDGTADELMPSDTDDDLNTVRRRLPTNVADHL